MPLPERPAVLPFVPAPMSSPRSDTTPDPSREAQRKGGFEVKERAKLPHAIRREDMSPRGYLDVMQQPDGDLIVSVYSRKFGEEYDFLGVEFCNTGVHDERRLNRGR